MEFAPTTHYKVNENHNIFTRQLPLYTAITSMGYNSFSGMVGICKPVLLVDKEGFEPPIIQ